jgi:RNA polymerase-interacting CarD/CdnL/TRCF family regulator
MNLKIGSKVFYPSHGAGWVKQQKEIEFNGEKKQYIEFEFINSAITVSTPINNVENLSVRLVHPANSIKDKISVLKKKPTKDPKTTDFNKLMELFKGLENAAI